MTLPELRITLLRYLAEAGIPSRFHANLVWYTADLAVEYASTIIESLQKITKENTND